MDTIIIMVEPKKKKDKAKKPKDLSEIEKKILDTYRKHARRTTDSLCCPPTF